MPKATTLQPQQLGTNCHSLSHHAAAQSTRDRYSCSFSHPLLPRKPRTPVLKVTATTLESGPKAYKQAPHSSQEAPKESLTTATDTLASNANVRSGFIFVFPSRYSSQYQLRRAPHFVRKRAARVSASLAAPASGCLCCSAGRPPSSGRSASSATAATRRRSRRFRLKSP